MSREWKPGDVALIRSMYDTEVVALRSGVPSNMGWSYSMDLNDVPAMGTGSTQTWSADHDGSRAIRPLLVIDPEDREQARHLAAVVGRQIEVIPYEHDDYAAELTAAGQRALRSLLAPPKPPEPTRVGAVVEDESGERWVRWQDGPRYWVSAGRNAHRYDDIAAVKVLSQGVPQ